MRIQFPLLIRHLAGPFLFLMVLPGFGQGPAFPLKLSGNNHYLVDQNGKPFLYHACTAWQISWKMTESEIETYLEDRKKKGFTAIQVQTLPFRTGQKNRAGQGPFLVEGDMNKPNPKYFEIIDMIVAKTRTKGLVLLMAPAWISAWEQDWRNHLGNGAAGTYGKWLGLRYKDAKNILWMQGGDVDPGELGDEMKELADSIEAGAGPQLQTYHAGIKSSSNFFHDQKWLDYNTSYDYGDVHPQVLSDYRKTPVKPTIMAESHYEDNGNNQGALRMRKQAYWTLLSGGCGHAYGNGKLWQVSDGWEQSLNSAGARNMQYLIGLFNQVEWWTLVPDFNHTAFTAGFGSGDNFAANGISPEGGLAMAYLPVLKTLTVNMSKFNGPVTAVWFDPTSGASSAIAGSPFANSGTRDFRSPERNAAGDGDFVLLLKGEAKVSTVPWVSVKDAFRISTSGSGTAWEIIFPHSVKFSLSILAPDGTMLGGVTGMGSRAFVPRLQGMARPRLIRIESEGKIHSRLLP